MQLRHTSTRRTSDQAGTAPARRDPAGRAATGGGTATGGAPTEQPAGTATKVLAVHRLGALVVAGVLLVFGILGFADGLDFFSTEGQQVLGLSSNGLLSLISVLTALVLAVAAFRSPRTASTVMIVVGTLFLLSALVNLAVLRTDFNFLAFEMSNVIFSVVTGLVLLLLGAYGRVSGHLPPDSPYARPHPDDAPDVSDPPPSTPEEQAAEHDMREAEMAMVNHTATEDQRRRVEAMSRVRTRSDRREVWMSFDEPGR